jgi:ribosomal protein S18 acetylase RimI-like enzyme
VSSPGLPRTLLSRIEDAGLNASAPPQQLWVDGWLVRLSPGKAQRARCINAVSEGLLPIAEKLALCQDLYRQAGLRLLLRITPFGKPADLDGWLERRHYQRFGESLVMVRESFEALPQHPLPAGLHLQEVTCEAYAHIVGEFRGSAAPEVQAHVQRLGLSPVPYRGSVLRTGDGKVLACAQTATEGDRVGLYDVFTAPAARGRGLSLALCAQLLAEARRQAAVVAYLQVDAHNHAARSVYRRLGFVDAYAYHYRALPQASG